MEKNRLEAFSDGVIAIIITIMVLEMKAPHGDNLAALEPVLPVFLSYVLSFIYVGIYWNNHHHLFNATKRVSGSIRMAPFGRLRSLPVTGKELKTASPFLPDWPVFQEQPG
jgi:uncharacterized membrane protein